MEEYLIVTCYRIGDTILEKSIEIGNDPKPADPETFKLFLGYWVMKSYFVNRLDSICQS